MTGAECLLRTLAANGISVCFMNPGTSEMQFVSALDRVPDVRGVLCLFEGVCSGAADGFARMTGRPAATVLHLGPGLGNGLANFHNARKARSPVLSIVGEHTAQHLRVDAPLTADIAAFARTVSDHVRTVKSAAEIGAAASEAIAAAMRPPGQIATLIVPADISWSEAGRIGDAVGRAAFPKPDSDRLVNAARLLRSGEPVGFMLSGRVLYGSGLKAAGRIAFSTGAKMFAHRYAARMESGRGRFQPVRLAYFPEKAEGMLAGIRHLILVEAKAPVSFFGYPGRRSHVMPEDCEVHLLAAEHEDGTSALEALAGEFGATAFETSRPQAAPHAKSGPLTADSIGRVVAAALPENSVVSDEMVTCGEAVWQHLKDAAPHDHLPVTGGSIGQCLPVAVGAAIACPDRKVLALEGDGSGLYTPQALWTMARESLDVVTVIFANRRYRILDIEMQRTGAEPAGPMSERMIDIGDPAIDWVRLAEAMGVRASRAESSDQFAEQFERAIRGRGPSLIEAAL